MKPPLRDAQPVEGLGAGGGGRRVQASGRSQLGSRVLALPFAGRCSPWSLSSVDGRVREARDSRTSTEHVCAARCQQ